MIQLHLFEPTFKQRLEEFLDEPIEDYFIERVYSSFFEPDVPLMRYCKVLTKRHVYDLAISEVYDHESVMFHKAERKDFHKKSIINFFKKYGAKYKENYVT